MKGPGLQLSTLDGHDSHPPVFSPQLGGRCWAGPRGGGKSGELLPGMGGAAEPALLRAVSELAGGIAWALSGHRACPRLHAGDGSEQLLGIRRCRASRVYVFAAVG